MYIDGAVKKKTHSVSCNKLEGGMGVFRDFSVN